MKKSKIFNEAFQIYMEMKNKKKINPFKKIYK